MLPNYAVTTPAQQPLVYLQRKALPRQSWRHKLPRFFSVEFGDFAAVCAAGGLGEVAIGGGCRWSTLQGGEDIMATVTGAVVAGAYEEDKGEAAEQMIIRYKGNMLCFSSYPSPNCSPPVASPNTILHHQLNPSTCASSRCDPPAAIPPPATAASG
ncbi:hypothetical protein HJC23_001254 [Cyclotella cryptica]|uniref:Uncharacterized protein n=1 Tax=Cyclotella cryptica TaxID=29204 RepID=A0ABD3NTA5_9STRA